MVLIDRSDSNAIAGSSHLAVVSSGSLRLDLALCTGGIPLGALVEISGPEESGKTTLCQHVVAEAQRAGRYCAWIDSDCTFPAAYSLRSSLRIKELYYSEPHSSEQSLDTLLTLAESGAFSVVVLDSIDTLVPSDELQGLPNMGSVQRNEQLLGIIVPRLSRAASRNRTAVLITNHPDRQLSAAYHQLHRHPFRLALKLHADLRLRLQRVEYLQQGEITIGEKIRVAITKNRFVPCLNTIDFDIIYDQGINKPDEVFTLGLALAKIQQGAEGYNFRTVHLGRTSLEAIRFLMSNTQVRNAIEAEIRRELLPGTNNAAS